MAELAVIPQRVTYSLTLDEEECDILLCALDFARTLLSREESGVPVSADYIQVPAWYQARIDKIEQVLAARRP
jgi:hypothetical protein